MTDKSGTEEYGYSYAHIIEALENNWEESKYGKVCSATCVVGAAMLKGLLSEIDRLKNANLQDQFAMRESTVTNPDLAREELEKCFEENTVYEAGQRFVQAINEQLVAFLLVAKKYSLNPFTKGIYWRNNMSTTEQVKAFQDGQKAGAKRCLELCEYVYMHSPDDRQSAVMECLISIATEFGLQGK